MHASRLWELVDRAVADPSREAEVAAEIDALYGRDCAVLVVDMAGFSRLAAERSIVAALLAIRRLQLAAADCTAAFGGEIVKFSADNVFAVFPDPAAARKAAEALSVLVPCGAGIGFGRILVCEADLYGVEVNAAAKLGEDVARAGQILPTPAAAKRIET